MSETLSKQRIKDEINGDYSRTTTKSPYYDGMRKAYHEILNDIDDGRFNSQIDYREITERAVKGLETAFKLLELHQPDWYLGIHYRQFKDIFSEIDGLPNALHRDERIT